MLASRRLERLFRDGVKRCIRCIADAKSNISAHTAMAHESKIAIKSKALEINLARSRVDVEIDSKYDPLQRVMSKYYGLLDGLNTFLKELSHPYRNWSFIIKEARNYCLEYFHLLQTHPDGAAAADLFIDIFIDAVEHSRDALVQRDAVDHLMVFLTKLLRDAGDAGKRFFPVLEHGFQYMGTCSEEIFRLFVSGYYAVEHLGSHLAAQPAVPSPVSTAMNRMLLRYYRHTYDYWLSEPDPGEWFAAEAADDLAPDFLIDTFDEVSHARIHGLQSDLLQLESDIASRPATAATGELLALPGFHRMVEEYRSLPQRIRDAAPKEASHRWTLLFLFHIMNLPGLSRIHEETLRDINRTLARIISRGKLNDTQQLIQKTFTILKNTANRYPGTALNCVLNLGRVVKSTDAPELSDLFMKEVIHLGFQTPMIEGVGDDWQIKVNATHIQNIRTWMELIEFNPKRSTRLLSGLIIHLALCGVFIRDIDLFPRDITQLLNSDVQPVYNLVKQLTRLFPAYFNDIGAEGTLRDISTQMDELTRRGDPLIHFLRKQSHVESSNRILELMEASFLFWRTEDKEWLRPFLPPLLFAQVDPKSPYTYEFHRILRHLEEMGVVMPEDLISISPEDLHGFMKGVPDIESRDFERMDLVITLYKMLNQKYKLRFVDVDQAISQLRVEGFPEIDRLESAFAEPDLKKRLGAILDYMGLLKGIICSDQTYEIREDIYKKRHITVDIPSMYGSYHEMKFDCLGLTLRLEAVVNAIFEELIDRIDLNLITKATFFQIYDLLLYFNNALQLDGINSAEFATQLDFLSHSLEARGFTFTQYLDIFKGFARAVRNIINDYFNNVHEQNLIRILEQVPAERILPKYFPKSGMLEDPEKFEYRLMEIFLRDRIALSLGLQQLDLMLSRILHTLFKQADKLPDSKLHKLLNYDPKRSTRLISNPRSMVQGIIYLGNKGLNLVKLTELAFPIPPGFIISTEVFRCREIINSYSPAEKNFREQVARHIVTLEKKTGKGFDDPANPLLFSVRSGSSISQPGMMDTFLNVGLNENMVSTLGEKAGSAWFAWDNYRRFLQCYGMSFGLERDDFDAIIRDFKQTLGTQLKRGFTGDQMRDVALAYKQMVQDAGIEILEDPFEQLLLTIKCVLASWESSKARSYRKIMGISDDWGTAVTVQSMVYGNLSEQAGSGVVFTHNPRWSDETLRLWGDFTLGNQGEDVVAGLVNTMPISLMQQEIEMRDTDMTLETHFPDIYEELKRWASQLVYKRGWSPQELEFTFEGPTVDRLYLLQSRDMAMRERKKVITFDPADVLGAQPLGHGVGVSGGAMSGRLVFTLSEIDRWRKLEPDASLILARSDTVPDDILEIHAADGLLTARGGVTSHASVVAHRLGKTCVVGCGHLVCDETNRECRFHRVTLTSGDLISIDGREGSVYQGLIKVKES